MPGAYTNHSSSSSFCRASCLLFHILCSVVQLKCASLKTVLFFAKEDAEDEPACLYVVVIRYNSYAHSAGFIVVGLRAEKNALKRQKWRKKHEPSNYSTKETLFSILACPVRSLVLYKERGGERNRTGDDEGSACPLNYTFVHSIFQVHDIQDWSTLKQLFTKF